MAGYEGCKAFNYVHILDLCVSSVCSALLLIWLSLDVWNAIKRNAYWFPGQALVLSALTVQLISFIYKLNSSLESDKNSAWFQNDRPLFINTARIMICVLIGYLLPGMGRYSFTNFGSNIGALALSVVVQMASQVCSLREESSSTSPSHLSSAFEVVLSSSMAPSPSTSTNAFWFLKLPYRIWLPVSWSTLFTVIMLLVFLLSCAVLAGKNILNIMSRKVPLALSCCRNCAEGHRLQCHSIGDHVAKCWIVVRASQPDYIMARSVFGSFVGLVVTVFIVFSAVDWTELPKIPTAFVSRLTPLYIQSVIILIGWIIILFRWFTSVMYFSRDLRSLYSWEDFSTRNIAELKANLNAQCRERLFREKRLPKRAIQATDIASSVIAIRLYSLLLTMALCLQKLMVLLSKACWYPSEIIFRMIRPLIFSRENNMLFSGSNISATDENPFFKYKEALDIIRMPGEFAYSLWIANESAFKKVEQHMEKGFEKGKRSSQLIKLKEHRTGAPHDEAAISVEEEKHFQQIGKMSWKMKAVSLIRFMIFYYEDAVSADIDDAIQAYCQAWPLLDIVDLSNPEAKLVSEAADKKFDAIEDIWKQLYKMKSVQNPKYGEFKEQLSKLEEEKMKKGQLCQLCEEENLKLFSKEEEAKAIKVENYKDSFHDKKEWMKNAAAKCSLYKTRKALDLDRAHSMDRFRMLLANVIFGCIDAEVDKAVIKNSNKWAEEGNEMGIIDAAYIAGIAKGLKWHYKDKYDQVGDAEV